MQNPDTPTPPRPRLAGFFYLLTFLTAILALPSFKLIVATDAAATATNILAHKNLFLLGFTGYVLNIVAYIVVTQLFYDLFRPVSRPLSQLAAFFSLIGCAIQAAVTAFYLAPLVLLSGSPALNTFTTTQLQTLSLIFLKLNTQAYNIGIISFGFYCALIGCLAFRSTYLPRFAGVFMMLSGAAWLTFLWPPLITALSPYNRAIGATGELVLTFTLLIGGVNLQRWNDQQSTSASP